MLRRQVVLGAILSLVVLALASPGGAGPGVLRHDGLSRSDSRARADVARPQSEGPLSRSISTAAQDFVDPPGDTVNAVDITTVSVTNDGGGDILLDIQVPGQQYLHPEDRIFVYIDADKNIGTGDALGADYLIDIDGNGAVGGTASIALAHWTAGSWDYTTPQSSLQGAFYYGERIVVNRADLGSTGGFIFDIEALWPDNDRPNSDWEFAPDTSRTWSYTLVTDVTPPVATPRLASCGRPCRAGHVVGLPYDMGLPEGRTHEEFRIRSTSARWSVRFFENSEHGNIPPEGSTSLRWTMPWPIPATVIGWLRWCGVAVDVAGNRSPEQCAPLRLPRIRTDALQHATISGGVIRLSSITLRGLPRRTKIRIKCLSGCSLDLRRVDRNGGAFSITFRPAVGRVGAKIAIRAMHARWVGYYELMTIRAGKWGEVRRCLPPGLMTPTRRCR